MIDQLKELRFLFPGKYVSVKSVDEASQHSDGEIKTECGVSVYVEKYGWSDDAPSFAEAVISLIKKNNLSIVEDNIPF